MTVMFEKQIKVAGDYVKGKIINGILHTNQLVTCKTGKPLNAYEIQAIIEELQLVKQEMEK